MGDGHGQDGQGVLDQNAADGIDGTALLDGPLFHTKVDGTDWGVGHGDLVVLQSADEDERQGQDDSDHPNAGQGQHGARQLETLFRRVDDQLVSVQRYGRDGQG